MKGLFILSLDTEIAWGTYGAKKLTRSSDCFNRYRDYFPRLIELLDQYNIPATWAVVGHLFLDQCDGHPDLPQPHYAWSSAPDSYRDPCSNLERAPWYYGPDIIAQIRAAKTQHEIGTHTFTHVIAGDPAVTPTIWDAQLAASASIHAENGLPMQSIVFPQNKLAYLDRLPVYGLIAYRGVEQRWYHSLPRPVKRAFHLVDRAFGFPPPTYDPSRLQVGEALVNLPSSQFLMAYDGPRGLIPTRARVRQAQTGLSRAVRLDHLYHLWFHPFNLGTSPRMFDALEAILETAARMRDNGQLDIRTMADAARWIIDGMPGWQRHPKPFIPSEAWT
jgi:hypothetical protein